ncbi:MAG: zinc ribbon domain-containing protein [Acidobacteria bacterium]|nr:zinc ribbon domain-containing protein [Acidobacteriota bacterium]
MPIFEYECLKCGNEFERLVRGPGAADAVTCPGCGSKKVEQLYSAFAGRSKSGSGATRSLSSGCSSCSARSCTGCK